MRLYSPTFRLVSIVAAVVASAVASAVNITFVSEGTITATATSQTFTESVVYQSHPGLANLTNYVETFTAISDTATYTSTLNPLDSLTISIDPNSTATSDPSDPNLIGFASSWTYLSGTGAYANLSGGHGSYTQNDNFNDSTSATTIKGELSPVPEPASIAALGLGAVGLLRRRKRA